MSSRTEILRERTIDCCGNPKRDTSLNQRALRAIREGEEMFNPFKGKPGRVARREARKQAMQDSEIQPPSLPDTIQPDF